MEKNKFTPEDDLIHLLHLLKLERKYLYYYKGSVGLITYQRNSRRYNLTKSELDKEIDDLCNKYNLHE